MPESIRLLDDRVAVPRSGFELSAVPEDESH